MATISTSGISPGQIIRSEHLLRVINALNGVTPIDIIITGSLSVSGSTSFTGSTYLKGLPNTSRANVITYDPITGQLSYLNSASLGVTMSVSQPGGTNTQIQYNSGSVLAATSSFTFNYTLQSLQQGNNVSASSTYAHAQGNQTTASGQYSHAEGATTYAKGLGSHAEGIDTISSGSYSHTEGESTQARGNSSHAEGSNSISSGSYSHAEGDSTIASGRSSHAEGQGTQAVGEASHTEGENTISSGSYSHAEGFQTISTGEYSHAEGNSTISSGSYSHAEGDGSQAIGDFSHAEGNITIASGSYSHAEGDGTRAEGPQSHAEGIGTIAIGNGSHAEGESTNTIGQSSHAEGINTIASGSYSHVEGYQTIASGDYSHAEGAVTQATGESSHAEGYGTIAFGNFSHAEGYGTISSGSYQHVQGQYNISSSAQSAFIIGNGILGSRSNLVFASGSTFEITGSLRVSGSITGSLFGTSSWANNSTTASYALNFNPNSIITGSVNRFPYYSSSNSFGSSVISQTGELIGIHTTSSIAGSVMFAISRPAQQSQIAFTIGNPGSLNSTIYSNNTLGISATGNVIMAAGTSSNVEGNPTRLIITGSTGNIGIGTLTPNYTLDISGSTRINNILILEPRTTTPSIPTNGMVIVSGSGADQHIYCYLNNIWKQLD